MSSRMGQLTLKHNLIGWVVFLVLALGFSNALAQTQRNPIALVPPNAVAVARINWTVVRQDQHFRAMLNADQVDRALAQMKISGSEVSEIIIFSGLNSTPTGVWGGIFRGTYSVPAVTAQLKSQEFSEDLYKGRTIYVDQRDKSWSSVLRSGMLVVGSQKGVQGVIDVELNPRLSLTSKRPFTTLLSRFTTSRRPISFMMAWPLEYQAVADVGVKVVSAVFSLSGLGPLGFVIEKIGFPYAMGFTMARSGATYPAELVAQMKDATSAALISGTLNVAQAIGLNMPSDRMSQSDREILKSMSVTRTEALLSIKLVLREQDLPTPPRR